MNNENHLMQVPVEELEKPRRDTSRRLGLGIWRLCDINDTWIEQRFIQVWNGSLAHYRLALL